jgi:hypothetical protein
MNYRIALCEAGMVSLMFNDTLPNSTVPYWEQ